MKKQKIAIVYDWMDKQGGVERLLLILHEMYPHAQWLTSVHNLKTAPWTKDLTIFPSFMQILPGFVKKSRLLSLPFYPLAFSSFNLSNYDLVVTITSSFANAVRVPKNTRTKYISIILTPPRYIWTHRDSYFSPSLKFVLERSLLNSLRSQDIKRAHKPQSLITISKHIQKRVKTYYGRTSQIIYPPFDFTYWNGIRKKVISKKRVPRRIQALVKKEFYLSVGRLEKYKRVDIAIDAVKKVNKTLVVVGTGSMEKKLKKQTDRSTIFLGQISDLELGYLYSHARALIMPQNEDFGYTAVEAQFFGCPVIAYKTSGVSEIVTHLKTGVLFSRQSVKGCVDAIERLDDVYYNVKKELKKNRLRYLDKFKKNVFVSKLTQVITHLK